MSDILPGIYEFADARATNHVAGKAYVGVMTVTSALARDPYVQGLVGSGQLKYVGASSAPVVAAGPKLIDRSVPDPEPRAEPEVVKEPEFKKSAKAQDRK